VILPDVNVLVFAFRREAIGHQRYATWLRELVAGGDELAVVESTLVGFLRVVTNRRVFSDPAPLPAALALVEAVRAAPRAVWLPANDATWEAFGALGGADPAVRGNLVPDAWLAALCIAHGGRLATADRGMARFPGLDWFDPAAG
jgi:toxin-antitoxin system PIN domain toxin